MKNGWILYEAVVVAKASTRITTSFMEMLLMTMFSKP